MVATEVRSLAQRSAAAAREIRALIGDSATKVETGSKHVADSGRTLEEIVDAVKRVTDTVSEIAAASTEQSAGVERVSEAVVRMDQVTQANAAQTEELTATAESLATRAQQLLGLVGRFRIGESGPRAAVVVADGGGAPAVTKSAAIVRAAWP